MLGETNLDALLRAMQAELQDGEFVFCSVNEQKFHALDVEPLCLFRETEGITLILPKEQAEQQALDYAYVSRMISLNVHSSLEAVGFLAAITSKLAAQGISVNPVSAYYHDHLFVASHNAERTLELLQEFSGQDS